MFHFLLEMLLRGLILTNFKVPYFQPTLDKDGIFLWFRAFYGRWSGEDLLKTRVVPIGEWDMDSTDTVIIPFGSNLNFQTIIHMSVIVNNDSQDQKVVGLTGIDSLFADSGNINISRSIGGIFDNAGFSDISINRGDISIWFST